MPLLLHSPAAALGALPETLPTLPVLSASGAPSLTGTVDVTSVAISSSTTITSPGCDSILAWRLQSLVSHPQTAVGS